MKNLSLALLMLASIKLSFAQPVIDLEVYKTGFSNPVDIANCGDARLFIVEQSGYIRIIDGLGNVNAQAFLDIDSRVGSGGERGLLGLAFHPDYKNNGFFYVNYTNNSGNTTVSRFSVSAADPDAADPASEEILFTVNQPFPNHNGGNIEFGPDGFLYIGMGDGGSGDDPSDNGQNPQVLLGKMLRIDIDTATSYKIPPTNPFVNDPNVHDAIWALGLRNPWRFSFDRLTGDLWIGDVGQVTKEEIDFQPASSPGGENYGWKCFEGNDPHLSSSFGCSFNHTPPVFDLGRSLGSSITGGYVYRGCEYPNLFGHYVFCDYGSGNFWTIQNNGGSFQATFQLQSNSNRYVTFGEDMNGELYVGGLNGTIYRVTETTATATLPTITPVGGPILCPGDSVILATQAGYATNDWLLDDVVIGTGLQITATQPGDYTLRVSGNNGCLHTTPAGIRVILLSSPAPVITALSNSFCGGDSLELSTTINFSTYDWSNGADLQTTYATQGGDFYVTVADVNGCVGVSAPFTVQSHPMPQPVVQQTGSLCSGDSVILFTETFASYLWSTIETTQQIIVSLPGDYTVEVTDSNGCMAISDTLTLSINMLAPPVMLPGNDIVQCGDGVVEITTLDAYDEYSWSTGDSSPILFVSANGAFNITVSDSNGCEGVSDTVRVEFVPDPPVTNILQSSSDSNVIYAEDSGYHYQWYEDGVLLPDDTLRDLVAQAGVEYTVELTDSNGCRMLSSPYQLLVNSTCESWFDNISIQPNPFTSEIILKYAISKTSDIHIRLLNLTGKEISIVLNEKQGAGSHDVRINARRLNMSEGFYFLEIQNSILRKTFKVVKM